MTTDITGHLFGLRIDDDDEMLDGDEHGYSLRRIYVTPGARPVDHGQHIVALIRALALVESDPEHWQQQVWSNLSAKLASVDGVASSRYDYDLGIEVPLDEEGKVRPLEPEQVRTCGTAFCFAGWAVADSGAKWLGSSAVVFDPAIDGEGMADTTIVIDAGKPEDEEDNRLLATYVSHRAQKLLGIDRHDADWLFHQSRTLTELRHGVAHLIERHLAEMYPPPKPVKHVYTVHVRRTSVSTHDVVATSEEEAGATAVGLYGPGGSTVIESVERGVVAPEVDFEF